MNVVDVDEWEGLELSGGRYLVGSELGEGGMAIVYRAEDRNLNAQVVIKTPRLELLQDKEFAARFRAEVAALVALAHPHIVKVTDVGERDGMPFAVMQYLAGGSLEDRIKTDTAGAKIRMPIERIADWLPQIAAALDFVHAKGFLHRDVKPANVLFDAEMHPYLSDFGIIKAASSGSGDDQARTKTGRIIGTEFYMSPESIMGRTMTGASDQYSLAVMVYELLAGRRPFVGPPTAVLVSHTNKRPPPLQSLVPELSESVCEAIHRGLAKKPSERFANCAEFANAVLVEVNSAAATKSIATAGTQPVRRQTAVQQRPPEFGKTTNSKGSAAKITDTASRRKVAVAEAPGFASAEQSAPRPGEAAPTAILSTLKAPSSSKNYAVFGGLAVVLAGAAGFFAINRNSKTTSALGPKATQVADVMERDKAAPDAPPPKLPNDTSKENSSAAKPFSRTDDSSAESVAKKEASSDIDSKPKFEEKKVTLPQNAEVSKPAPTTEKESDAEPELQPSPREKKQQSPKNFGRTQKSKTAGRGYGTSAPSRTKSGARAPDYRSGETRSQVVVTPQEKMDEDVRRAKVLNAVKRGAPLPPLGTSIEAQELIDIASGKKKPEYKPPMIKKLVVKVPAGVHVDPITGIKVQKFENRQVPDPFSVKAKLEYDRDFEKRAGRFFPDRFEQFQREMLEKANANDRFGDEIRTELDKLDQLQKMAINSRDKELAGKFAEGMGQFAVKFGDDKMLDPKYSDPNSAQEKAKAVAPAAVAKDISKKIKDLRVRQENYQRLGKKWSDDGFPKKSEEYYKIARKAGDEADRLEKEQSDSRP